ncbi:hypothetical protein AB0F17_03425 [Nonomuraea sp. NPDC026600]|uniref:hypothetical protein n=1 Tax=Nonomuraea sp. NPDC026600 TaxID=3155363 RepID=UPI0033F06BD5
MNKRGLIAIVLSILGSFVISEPAYAVNTYSDVSTWQCSGTTNTTGHRERVCLRVGVDYNSFDATFDHAWLDIAVQGTLTRGHFTIGENTTSTRITGDDFFTNPDRQNSWAREVILPRGNPTGWRTATFYGYFWDVDAQHAFGWNPRDPNNFNVQADFLASCSTSQAASDSCLKLRG